MLVRTRAKERPGEIAGPEAVEAAGFEPASASAPSARFYERSSRFIFASPDGPGRRRGASPLIVPSVPRDQGPEGRAHSMTPGTGPWAARTDGHCYLSSDSQTIVGVCCWCRRFTSLQQTRLVSLDADRSRRNRSPPNEAYSTILEQFINPEAELGQRRRRSFMARSISRCAVLRAISRRLSYCLLRLATASSSFMLPSLV